MNAYNYLRLHYIKIINSDNDFIIPEEILDNINTNEDLSIFLDEYSYIFEDALYDAICDFRSMYDFVIRHDIDNCRYYECKYVGKEVEPGVFLGWNYYHGGGKHSAPGEIEWTSTLEFIDVTKEIKYLPVYTIMSKTLTEENSNFRKSVSEKAVTILV